MADVNTTRGISLDANQNLTNSELLCFMQNRINNTARDIIVQELVGFYSVEDMVAAKLLLYGLVDELKPENEYNPEA